MFNSIRVNLGIVVVALTISLLFYPMNFGYEWHSIQSLVVIQRPTMFASLFAGWFLAIVLLAMSRREFKAELATLCAILVIGMVGSWVLAARGNIREASLYAAQIRHLTEGGRIAWSFPSFTYFQWPGTFTLASVASQVSGLAEWATIVCLQFAWLVLFVLLVFLILSRAGGNCLAGTFGTIVLLLGSTQIYKLLQQFHPGMLALAQLTLVTAVAQGVGDRTQLRDSRRDFIISLAFLSVTVTHFISSVILAVAQLILVFRERRHRRAHFMLGVLLFVVAAAWPINYAQKSFADLVRGFSSALAGLSTNLFKPGEYFRIVGMAYFGGDVPVWARATRGFWLLAVYGFGALATLQLAVKSFPKREENVVIAFGFSALAVGAIAYTMTRGEDTTRLLTYAALPCIAAGAALLRWMRVSQLRWFALFGGLLVLLAPPSFLGNNNTVNLNVYGLRYEEGAGEFLRTSLQRPAPRTMYSQVSPWVYYVPASMFQFPQPNTTGLSESDFEREFRRAAQRFLNEESAVWVETRRNVMELQFWLGPQIATSSVWATVTQIIGAADRIYDNLFVVLYLPR